MSILQHRRNVRRRAQLCAANGRQSFPHERPRASTLEAAADDVVRELPDPVPAAAPRRPRKAKADPVPAAAPRRPRKAKAKAAKRRG